MFKIVLASAIALLSNSNAEDTTDKLHFVQEVVRHGARAPTANSVGFSVYAGELTSSGMR
jgi:hypothetical protein